MIICGLNKTTLLDYPEHVAATIFTGGCNFRCPFCQNASLLGQIEQERQIPEEEVLRFLEKRAGILDGVCVTGGEPTLQPDLEGFLAKIKALGYLIKLDTNGSRPEVIKKLVSEGLVDYVAMDVKASKPHYARLIGRQMSADASGIGQEETSADHFATGIEQEEISADHFATGIEQEETSVDIFATEEKLADQIEESIQFIMSGAIPYEFRTTAVKGLHNIEEFDEIGRWIAGARAYFIQNYRDDGEVLVKGYQSFEKEELEQMRALAHKYIDRVELRGVD